MSRMKDQRRAKSQKDKRRPLKVDEQDILEEIDLDRRMLELES
jgi:hypothetical protein